MEYRDEIDQYQPTDESVAILRATPFVLLAGITGAGRDTIVSKLVQKDEYFPYITSTTRAMRTNDGVPERDGVEYYFLTMQQAVQRLRSHGYIEVSVVHEQINGLTTDELQKAHASGKIAISDITPDGVDKFKTLSPEVIAIFVVPPSYDAWLKRAMSRYDNDDEFWASWPPRKESAIRELQDALNKPYYHFVINDNLEAAVEACHKIAHSHDTYSHKDDEARAIVAQILAKIKAQE